MEANNMKAMREALESARNFLLKHCCGSSEAQAIISRIDCALAAPPRNCDVLFLDRVEMYGAFKDWCNARGHTMEPKLAYDAFDWLLALATEKEGGNDGR